MKSGIIPVVAAAFIGLHALAIAQTTAPGALAPASSPVVARGAVVRLKVGTPLKFEQRPVRATSRNEEFIVLDVRKDQQTLYLSLIDKSGMEIAVTAPLPAAILVEQTDTELGKRIAKVVSKGQYAAALALVSIWGHEASQREEVTKAINELKATEAGLTAAKNATSAAQAEAQRTLRHVEATASVGENPAFARAAENRRQQAAKIEANAQEILKEAQTKRNAALAAFRSSVGGLQIVVPSKIGRPVIQSKPGNVSPDVPSLPYASLPEEQKKTLIALAERVVPRSPASTDPEFSLKVLANIHGGLDSFTGDELATFFQSMARAKEKLGITDAALFVLWAKMRGIWKNVIEIDAPYSNAKHIAAVLGGPSMEKLSKEALGVSEGKKLERLAPRAYLLTAGQGMSFRAEATEIVVAAAAEYAFGGQSIRTRPYFKEGESLHEFLFGPKVVRWSMELGVGDSIPIAWVHLTKAVRPDAQDIYDAITARAAHLSPRDYEAANRLLPFENLAERAENAALAYLADLLTGEPKRKLEHQIDPRLLKEFGGKDQLISLLTYADELWTLDEQTRTHEFEANLEKR